MEITLQDGTKAEGTPEECAELIKAYYVVMLGERFKEIAKAINRTDEEEG